mgnify:CR=1 FL=1
MTISDTLARFVCTLDVAALPEAVTTKAVLHILDTVGVALLGHTEPSAGLVLAMAADWGGEPQATVWGGGRRLPASSAALCNGTLSHAYDYDDTHGPAVAHISACAVPAAMAAAEMRGSPGRALIAGVVAGYEVGSRIGLAAPHVFNQRGFHGTAIFGTFAAAAAAARVMGLTPEQTANAFGLCGSLASGSLQFIRETASSAKRLHPGWAAHAGLVAADLACRGFDGPREVFEGKLGLFNSHIQDGRYDLGVLTDGLGRQWETLRISYKPYPACHILHATIDICVDLYREGVRVDEIDAVTAYIDEHNLDKLVEPRSLKNRPPNPHAARFSLPYCVAVALTRGTAGAPDFAPDALKDEAVLALAERVECRVDPDTEFPRTFPGRLTVRLRSGETITRHYRNGRGSPDWPLTREEVEAKFLANAAGVLGRDRSAALKGAILNLATEQDVRALGKLLA